MINDYFKIISRYGIYLLVFVVFAFVLIRRSSGDVALKVGPVKVTQKEFDQAFQSSQFTRDAEGRRAFAEQYVNQKLILLEAERQGMTSDPQFLNDLQKFWEERLMRASMLSKFDEYRPIAKATDDEVNQIYEESKGSKALPSDPLEAKEQIRVMIAQEKQSQLMSRWLDSLRQKTGVYINEQKLGLK